MRDDGSVKPAPSNVVITETRDLDAIVVQFIAPVDNGLIAAFADDLLDDIAAVLEKLPLFRLRGS